MDPTHIVQENKMIPLLIFEYFAQKNMSLLLDQALEKTCLFEYTETEGMGIIHLLLEMIRLTRELEFVVENQAIDFVKSYCKIKDKGILKKLEDIPYFKHDNEDIGLNTMLVIVNIAHKVQLEFLWERFLNYIVSKYFIKSIFK